MFTRRLRALQSATSMWDSCAHVCIRQSGCVLHGGWLDLARGPRPPLTFSFPSPHALVISLRIDEESLTNARLTFTLMYSKCIFTCRRRFLREVEWEQTRVALQSKHDVFASKISANFTSVDPLEALKGRRGVFHATQPSVQTRITESQAGRGAATLFRVFGMTRPGIEPTTYHSQGRHSITRPLS